MNYKKILLKGLLILGLYSCDSEITIDPPKVVDSIYFSPTVLNLKTGETFSSKIKIIPSSYILPVSDIIISSSVADIVKITINQYEVGTISYSVEGIKEGTTYLTISLKNSTKKAVAIVNVTNVIVPIKSINISHKVLTMNINETFKLYTNILPKNATDTSVFWTTDNNIATVSNTGLITAKSGGTVNVKATSFFDNSIFEVCTVTIIEPVKSIEVTPSSVTVNIGSKATLTANALPSNATNKVLNFSIENTELASLVVEDNVATITPLKVGTTKIIITSSNPDVTLEVPLSVVLENITSVNIIENDKIIDKKESYTLNTEILPVDAKNKTLKWVSQYPDIVSVYDGIITGIKSGISKIYAISNADNTKMDSCIVTVPGIALNKNILKLDKKISEILTVQLFPKDFNSNVIIWSSSNVNVATVNSLTGEVIGVGVGEADIIVTLANTDLNKPPYTDTCKVYVYKYLKSLTFSNKRVTLNKDAKITLVPNLLPIDAINKIVNWYSSDQNVASVNENGEVTALAIGETFIKAVSDYDNNIKDSVKVFVNGIILDYYVLTLKVGNNQDIMAKLYPTDLSNMNLNWVSSLPDVVSVNNVGNIKTLKTGTATITVTSAFDNTITAKCEVNVIESNQGINLSNSNLTLNKFDTKIITAEIVRTSVINKTVLWISDNKQVATVNANGQIVTHLAGYANIIAYSQENNNIRDTCKLYVNGINLDIKTLSLPKEKIAKLSPAIFINNISNLSVIYTSENNKVTVDGNGLITAKDIGEVSIIVSSVFNSNLKDTCKVTIQGIQFSVPSLEITKGLSKTVTVTTYPSTLRGGITWSSEDVNIASVNLGDINGIGYGQTNIVATYTDNPEIKEKLKVSIIGIELDKTSLILARGKTANLKYSGYSTKSLNLAVKYTSSADGVASVDNNGLITGNSSGDAIITVTFVNDLALTATCKVTVNSYIESLIFRNKRVALNKNTKVTLTPELAPADAIDKKIIWSSSNQNVASVNENGEVTALAIGETFIKAASSFDNTIKDSVKVFVNGIILDNYVLNLKVGNNQDIMAKLYPTDLSNMNLNWVSSLPDVVSVNNVGNIKALKSGTSIITVTSAYDNTITATCEVNVIESNQGINLSSSNLTLNKRETKTITAVIVSSTITNKTVIWSSDNKQVATVDANGQIVTHLAGYANIIAYSQENNNIRDTCKLYVNGINLDIKTLSIPKEKTAKLTPTVFMNKITDLSVTYTSENNKATVDANGLITAKDTGMVRIIVSSVYNSNLKDTCKVTIQGIFFNVPSLEITKGLSKTVTVSTYPSTLTGGITWSSEDVNIATVNSGIINGIGYGQTNIVATYTDNPDIKEKLKVSIVGIELDKTSLTLSKGKTANLKYSGFSAKTSNLAVKYTSSANSIVSVDNNGLITANSAGDAIITVAFLNDLTLTATCKVTVNSYITSIIFRNKRVALNKNAKVTLTPDITPIDAIDKKILWSSSNQNVASVNVNGEVTAIMTGETYVKATSDIDNNIKDSVKVFVNGILLDYYVLNLKVGNNQDIIAKLYPTDLSNMNLNWVSSLPDIVSVNNLGNIIALKKGTSIITVTSAYDNTITATCEVNVTESTQGINLSNLNLTLNKRETKTITAVIVSTTITNKTVLWISDNNQVATVDANGKIVTHLAGYVNIIAYSQENNNIRDTCKLYVNGVNLDLKTLSIPKGTTGKLTPTVFINKITDLSVTYTSENNKVTVDANGLITAKDTGEVRIFVSSVYNSNLRDTCKVIIQGLLFSVPSLEILKKTSKFVSVFYYPSTLDGGLEWSSEDVNIASVNFGTITGVDYGQTNIIVKYLDNIYVDRPIFQEKLKVSTVGIELDKTTLSLATGKTAVLKSKGYSAKTSNLAVKYTSSADAIASVDNNGLVTANSSGDAIITVTFINDLALTATCKVSVYNNINSIIFKNKRVAMNKNTKVTLTPDLAPLDAINKKVIWSSSNQNVASVNQNGEVTAIMTGETYVKATSDVDNTVKDSVKVFVNGIVLNNYVLNIRVGTNQDIIAKLYPTDLSNMNLNWVSSLPDIVSVNNVGNITALKIGTSIITVTSAYDNTITATCEVNVIESTQGIILSNLSLTLNKRETKTITATITTAIVTNKTVLWISDNNQVATVDANGQIVTHLAGYANIIAYSQENNNIRDTCKLYVNGINFDLKTLSIPKVTSAKLTPTVFINKITDLSVTYLSENNNKATVDANGLITAKDTGEVRIFVSSVYNSNLRDTCKVTIQGILFNVPSLEVSKSSSKLVSVTFYPSTLNGGITWSSEDEKIATVNLGTISGVGYGQTNIIATYSDNPILKEKLKVSTVGIELDKTTLTIPKGKTANLKYSGFSTKTSNLAVKYTSNADAIASVDINGLVTANSAGEAIITVTFLNDLTISATCNVTVQSLSVNTNNIILKKRETISVNYQSYPNSIKDNLVWSLKDQNIVSIVPSFRFVTGQNTGTTVLTISSKDYPDLKQDITLTVKGIILNDTILSLNKKETRTLSLSFFPSDIVDKSVTWTSDDVNVAAVENGVITAVSPGITNINVALNSDNTQSARCQVTVKGIKFDRNKIVLDGEAKKLAAVTVTKYPSDLNIGVLTWSTDNPTDFIVDQGGVIITKKTATSGKFIAVSSVDNRFTDTANVQILGISLDKTNVYLSKNSSTNVKAKYYYIDGTISQETTAPFVSENPLIASVNSNGLITANDYGGTNINLSKLLVVEILSEFNTNSYLYTSSVKVYVPNITLPSNLFILNTNTNKLPVTFIPSDLPDKTLIYESDNPNVLTINSDGTLNKIGKGTANVKVKYRFNTNEEVSTTSAVTIYDFYLTKNKLELSINKNDTLRAVVNLGNKGNAYLWSITDESVATVSQFGVLSPKNKGRAIVYIRAYLDSKIYDSCIVDVVNTTNIVEFKFEKSKNPGMETDVILNKFNNIQFGGDFKYIANNKLIPTITLEAGSTIKVKGVTQTSGKTVQDFTSPVYYQIISPKGDEMETYRVALNFVNDTFKVENNFISDGSISCKVDYKQYVTTAIIADSMNGFAVIAISFDAFNGGSFSELRTVSFNNIIKLIGSDAFKGCRNLMGDLYIPPSVNEIYFGAFTNCVSLSSIKYRSGTDVNYGGSSFNGVSFPIYTYTWP